MGAKNSNKNNLSSVNNTPNDYEFIFAYKVYVLRGNNNIAILPCSYRQTRKQEFCYKNNNTINYIARTHTWFVFMRAKICNIFQSTKYFKKKNKKNFNFL